MQGAVPQAKFLQTGIKMVKIIFFSLQNLIELIKNSIYVRLSDVDVGDLGRIEPSWFARQDGQMIDGWVQFLEVMT